MKMSDERIQKREKTKKRGSINSYRRMRERKMGGEGGRWGRIKRREGA